MYTVITSRTEINNYSFPLQKFTTEISLYVHKQVFNGLNLYYLLLLDNIWLRGNTPVVAWWSQMLNINITLDLITLLSKTVTGQEVM